MIRNSVAHGLLLAGSLVVSAGCRSAGAQTEGAYQGVVELDERTLGFEVGGRVSAVNAVRGALATTGQDLATLDSAIESTVRAGRESDVAVARAELALIKAGSRGEEVRAMEAQLRAARATESLLTKSLDREKALRARNASTDAAVEDLEGRLERSVGERQSVEQRLAELRRGSRVEERTVAEARIATAAAAVQLEDERLRRHTLLSPADGTILDVHAKTGEIVSPGAPVVTLGDTKHPYADVFVPQGKLGGLKMGVRAEVRVDGEAAPFSGVIETVAQKTEFTPRFLFSDRERPNIVVRIRVRIEDPAERLHAGVPAFAVFHPGSGEERGR
jgi:HlyD family secretion protein